MKNTAKFTISLPQDEFKSLEDRRLRAGLTRSAFILKAVRAWRDQNEESGQVGSGDSEVKEDSSPYGAAVPKIESGELLSLLDPAEIRKRAMEAAGRFASLKGDLSLNHDEVLAEAFARTAHRDKTGNDQMPRRKD